MTHVGAAFSLRAENALMKGDQEAYGMGTRLGSVSETCLVVAF